MAYRIHAQIMPDAVHPAPLAGLALFRVLLKPLVDFLQAHRVVRRLR